MATLISGSQGSVTIGVTEKGATISVTEWSGTITQDVFENTPFTVTDNAKTKGLGMSTITGTLTGFPLTTIEPELGTIATNNAPAIAGMVLQSESGKTYTFAAVTTMTVGVTKTGAATVTIDFESSGDPVIA